MLGTEHLVLAASLALGLFFYEQFGERLGGVMVLPLVTAYGLFDVRILAGFSLGAVATYGVGELVIRRTLIYGRRLLYVYILAGMVLTAAALALVGVSTSGIALIVLPGIFAFNLHREGEPVRRMGTFVLILVPLYLVAHLVLTPFGFDAGLYRVFPDLRPFAIHAFHLVPTPELFPTASAQSATRAVDGTGVGGVIGSLVGGDAE
jgi:hypothetical protein